MSLLARLGCGGTGRELFRSALAGQTSTCSAKARVVDLNAEIARRALNLLMPKQKFHCPQGASTAVDECRLGSAQ